MSSGGQRSDVFVRVLFDACVLCAALRGVGANVVIMEEAAAMDPGLFTRVILPLFSVEKTVVLAISTIRGEENFYSAIMDMRSVNTRRACSD